MHCDDWDQWPVINNPGWLSIMNYAVGEQVGRVEGVRCRGLRSGHPVSGAFHGNMSRSERSSNVSVSESGARSHRRSRAERSEPR